MSNSTAMPIPESAGRGPIGVPGGTDRSYQVDVIVCAVITAVIGTAFVAMRFYTRGIMLKVLGWEDWLILIAQVFSVATCVSFILEASLGWDQHYWFLNIAYQQPLGKIGWAAILFYELSIWFSEVSIIMLYLRIWTYPWVRRTTYALLALVMVYNTWVFISVFTACIPLAAWWDFSIKPTYCHSKSVWWANTYMHIAVDFLIFSIPIPVIWGLHFPRKQKVILFFIFAFGFFICCISIIRAVLLNMTANSIDQSYDNVSTAFWTCVETNTTVVIACLMTLKPLMTRLFPRVFTHSSEQSSEPQDSSGRGRVPTIGSRPTRPYNGRRTIDDDDLETGMPPGFDPAQPTLETIKDESAFSPTSSSSGTQSVDHESDARSHEKA